MTFKIEKLGENVNLVRGYRKENDIKYFCVCTLYKPKKETKWQIHGFMSENTGSTKEVWEAINFLKNFPGSVYTYVSDADWNRFYKKHNFKRIDF